MAIDFFDIDADCVFAQAECAGHTGVPTGGTFTLTFNGHTTASLAYNAPATGTGSVQSAIGALTGVGSANVAVTSPAPWTYSVRFIGSLAGAYQTPIALGTNSLTGGTSPSVTAVESIPGGDSGSVHTTTDPRGNLSLADHDLLGRTTTTIAGFTTGEPSASTDQTTAYAFDGNDNVTLQTAVLPQGANNQQTAYVYGVLTTGSNPSDINSYDLLAQTQYPDPSTGLASSSASNDVTNTYNALGEVLTMQDENGSVHTYSRDTLGRLTADAVTTLGTGVDGSTRYHGFTYTALGLPLLSSTYASSAGTGTPLTQVKDAYNGFGQLTREYQSHSGAVVTSGPSPTPSVQYVYAGPSSTQNYSRLAGTQYPDARIVDAAYTVGAAGSPSQEPITSITHSGATATVTTTVAHGLSTANTVIISGASDPLYDGSFTITVTDSTHFTYTMTGTPAANASGSDLTVTPASINNSISRVAGLQDHATNSTLGTTAGQVLQAYQYLGGSTSCRRRTPTASPSATSPPPPPPRPATA